MSSLDTQFDFRLYQDPRAPRPTAPRKAPPQTVFATVALAGVVLSCGWVLASHLLATETATVIAAPQDVPEPAPTPAVRIRQAYAALFDSTLSLGASPGAFVPSARPAQPAPAQVASAAPQTTAPPAPAPAQQLAQNIPLPMPRPSELRLPAPRSPAAPDQVQQMAQGNKTSVIASLEADAPPEPEQQSTFQKLFGKLKPSGPALAYAAPDGGLPAERKPSIVDRFTAVYDIAAHTVYMPDGSKLEAHSGLGSMLDDPSHAHVRMRGVTPPHIYDLTLRESLFHGVQALRLNPVGGEGQVFGRTGLLAHTYMLGPNGDSNGCVSFRNYDAFLRAYMKQDVKRLLVVPRMT